MLTLIDHTEPGWADRYNRSHTRYGRENGAATYSRDIVRWHIPEWERLLPAGSVVSTCPLLTGLDVEGPVAVQYLHTFVRDNPLGPIRDIAAHLAGRCDRVVFVTAYRALHALVRKAGMESVFVPMTVDVDTVRSAAVGVERFDPGEKRAVYFGNVTGSRKPEFERARMAFTRAGWSLDVISGGWFEGRAIRQREAWAAAARYRYGVAVGRCALELHALGLRVMYSGAGFGGIAVDEQDWAVQEGTNWAGGTTTFDRDPGLCIGAFQRAMARPESSDVSRALLAISAGLDH